MSDQDEELLGRLLTELGGSEPAEGFAGRVVRGVEAQRRLRVQRPVWVWGLVTAVAVLAIVGGVWRKHGVPVDRKTDLSAVLRDEKSLLLRDDKKGWGVTGQVVRLSGERMRKRPLVVAQDQAEDVSRVASFPAPELPLTEQERLLQRAVHRGDPMEVAMLRPEERELQAKLERAEFDAFFPKPDPPLNDVASLGEGVGPKGLAGVDAAGPKAADRSLGQQNSLDKGNQGEKQ